MFQYLTARELIKDEVLGLIKKLNIFVLEGFWDVILSDSENRN